MQWNLIRMRKERGMNQLDMSKALGISADAYGKKERGQLCFNIDEMFKISELFNRKLEEIFLPRNFSLREVGEKEVNR